jgi:hypothetical protein
MTAVHKSKWATPVFCVLIGAACGAAFWIGGNPQDGAFAFALLTVFGFLVLAGGRSDLVRGLRGDGRDEYWARIDVVATAIAGHATIAAIIAMCLWEWSHGRDGTPYAQLGAIAGLAYLAGVAVLRWRS